MWKYSLVVIMPIFIAYHLDGQNIYKDFEDGRLDDWHQNNFGHWDVDSILPISGASSIHHNFDNSEAGFDAISYAYDILNLKNRKLNFVFSIRHSYNPSSSNNWAVWLVAENNADNMHPNGDNSGYILGVNFIGSDDYLKLWRKQDNHISEVLTTSINWQESFEAGSIVWLKIERSESGEWKVFYDLTGKQSWNNIGRTVDSNIVTGRCMGIYYSYTSSQDMKLWLDDISIEGDFSKDIEPPIFESYSITGSRTIKIVFSELIDTTCQENICRLNKKYFPIKKRWINNKELVLLFESEFDTQNLLELFGYSDLSGNKTDLIEIEFEYYKPQKYDVIVSEIMADPKPSAGLPEYEYLEIVNTSKHEINIYNWNLIIDDETIILPDYIIYPGKYLLICDKGCFYELPDTIEKLELRDFPALSNDGFLVQLLNSNSNLMHAMYYSRDLYQSTAKQEGGWSLEIIDIYQACIDEENWSESKSLQGGTPGTTNSVLGLIADTIKPFVTQLFIREDQYLEIVFSESMDEHSLEEMKNYQFTDEFIIDSIYAVPPFYERVILTFDERLDDFQKHILNLNSGLMDCSGNRIKDDSIFFGLPHEADSSDIIINEIMFESTDMIPEFIEIYNNSQKILDLKNHVIGYYDDFTESYSDQIIITRENMYLFPNCYLTVTVKEEQLFNFYQVDDRRKIIQPGKWKNLTNEGGKIGVISPDGSILDEAKYNKEMHFKLLYETSGVSLERIAFNDSGLNESNWHSASSVSGYATPCEQNSQFFQMVKNKNNFVFEPDEISPDNDGYQDFLTISYTFSKPGYMITIIVFSSEGKQISIIANNELCGYKGSYYWEGIDNNKNIVPIGYYIVYCEAIHPEGEKKQIKKSVLVLP